MSVSQANDGGRARLQRAVLRLVVSVLVLDAIAIAAYVLLDIGDRSGRVQTTYVMGWVAVTLAVVLPGLSSVRAVRARTRYERATRGGGTR